MLRCTLIKKYQSDLILSLCAITGENTWLWGEFPQKSFQLFSCLKERKRVTTCPDRNWERSRKKRSCGTAFGHMRADKNRNNTCWLYFSQTRLDQISWSQVRTTAELTHDYCLSHLVDISHEAHFQEAIEEMIPKRVLIMTLIWMFGFFSHEKCVFV